MGKGNETTQGNTITELMGQVMERKIKWKWAEPKDPYQPVSVLMADTIESISNIIWLVVCVWGSYGNTFAYRLYRACNFNTGTTRKGHQYIENFITRILVTAVVVAVLWWYHKRMQNNWSYIESWNEKDIFDEKSEWRNFGLSLLLWWGVLTKTSFP